MLNESNKVNYKFSVAPMLDWTDRHCRYFYRLMSAHALLYTEMVTTGAILYGKKDFLAFNEEEHPLVLQLGGSDPYDLGRCAKLAEERGYDAINLNVGCPSDRVQNGKFGACLMSEPLLVPQCVAEMREKVNVPVTVKTRIGIDHHDTYEFLANFIEKVSMQGVDQFIIHARKAWLKGLSPKENRELPELIYERVYRVKQEYPHLHITINGGIKSMDEIKQHLGFVDGVMLGREIYQNPYLLSSIDQVLYGRSSAILTREEIVMKMLPYIEKHLKSGGKLSQVTKHMLGLFHAQVGGRKWRQVLSEQAHLSGSGTEVVLVALEQVRH